MMKRIAFFCIFWLVTWTVAAQKVTEDIIYLNNGSILRGKIVENVVGDHTTIEIVGNNRLVISEKDIRQIALSQKVILPGDNFHNSVVGLKTDVNFLGGSTNTGGLHFVVDGRLPSRASLGAGFGLEWFDHEQLPLFAEARYDFLDKPFTPCIFAQAGWAVPLSKAESGSYSEYFGGPLAALGGGLKYNFSRHSTLLVQAGYRYQKTKTVTTYQYWYGDEYKTIRYDEYNRILFSIGFVFN